MTDPLFGLTYSPQKVRFESAAKLLTQRCPQIKGRRLWTYATWRGQESEYFVVSGFMEILPDSPKGRGTIVEPDPAGVLVEIRGTQCRISTPELFLSGKTGQSKKQLPAEPNELAINGLVADAMKRYEVAFGGKDAFVNELRLQKVQVSALPSVLQYQLETTAK